MRDGKEPFHHHRYPKNKSIENEMNQTRLSSEAKGYSDAMYPVTEHISLKCAPSSCLGPTLSLHVSGFNQVYTETLTLIYRRSSIPYTPELSATQEQHLTESCSTL